jgi:hypothetical protein
MRDEGRGIVGLRNVACCQMDCKWYVTGLGVLKGIEIESSGEVNECHIGLVSSSVHPSILAGPC